MIKAIAAMVSMGIILSLLSACADGRPAGSSSDSTPSPVQTQTSSDDISSASDSPTESSSTPQVTAFSTSVNGIPFGLSPEELLRTLRDKQIELVMPDYSQTIDGVPFTVQDGRWYNATSTDYNYDTVDRMHFWYNDKDAQWSVSVYNSDIPTEEGLRVGDSVEKMESIYGADYQKDVEDYNVYQYFNGNEYLNIFYDYQNTSMVSGWEITLWPYINND